MMRKKERKRKRERKGDNITGKDILKLISKIYYIFL